MAIGSQSLLEILPFVVECKSTHPFFETIAAFNVQQAADDYAAECAAGHPGFAYRVTVPCPPIKHASEIERRIVAKLVRDLIAANYVITVNDGEEDVLTGVDNEVVIFDALASTDTDTLRVSKKGAAGGRFAFVLLVWGNEVDIISDYSTSLSDVIKGANDLADQLDVRGR